MDLREKKTKRSIRSAFLALREKKPLERITVKELAGKAEISKATFYLHYRDIYDSSETLENELIQTCLKGIRDPETFLTNPSEFVTDFVNMFYSQRTMIRILFSGSRAYAFSASVEKALKDYILLRHPEMQNRAEFHILLSYQIHGAYNAFMENSDCVGSRETMDAIAKFSIQLSQNMREYQSLG
ncbi:MAG: TetR/AcrR family transcriptional regulator [Clostridiales bacterium]|nr:TetR/AcrR family transcriptional regulator [Clostridiales bacterium]